jgi:hypothetical protein
LKAIDCIRFEPFETRGLHDHDWIEDKASKGVWLLLQHKTKGMFGLRQFLKRKDDSDTDAYRIVLKCRPYFCVASAHTKEELLEVLGKTVLFSPGCQEVSHQLITKIGLF